MSFKRNTKQEAHHKITKWRQVPNKLNKRIPPPVERTFEKWLLALLFEEEWDDTSDTSDEIRRCRELVESYGCRLFFDVKKHWRESIYMTNHLKYGPSILAGGGGDPKMGCTAILHELGHHILLIRHQNPRSMIAMEEAAWRLAEDLARQHRLPFVNTIRRRALYSYRLGKLLDENKGSKRQNKRLPLPKSWRLVMSKRTAAGAARLDLYPHGKKGKRLTKRYIKRRTARAERRRPIESL